jgi:lathosterol oxidase
MDVILDVIDTFVFDRLYATILPVSHTGPGYTALENQTTYNQHVGVYFPLEPSRWVGASQWKRDHITRQALSLCLITW